MPGLIRADIKEAMAPMHFLPHQIKPLLPPRSILQSVSTLSPAARTSSVGYRNQAVSAGHRPTTLLRTVIPHHTAQSAHIHRQLHTSAKRTRLPTVSTTVKSASLISFLGSLFSSTARAENNMSYPDDRNDEDWRAVLSPGMFPGRTV